MVDFMLGIYGTILMTAQQPNETTDNQPHHQLNMEYIGACMQEHFQEVNSYS